MTVIMKSDVTAVSSVLPSALALAWQLGELRLDCRRGGVKLELLAAGRQLRLTLPSGGSFTLQCSTVTEWLKLLSDTSYNRLLGTWVVRRHPVLLVKEESSYRKVADLAGARIGVPADGAEAALTGVDSRAIAEAEGWHHAEMRWTVLDIAEGISSPGREVLGLVQALAAEEVDAVLANGIQAALLQPLLGLRPLISSAVQPEQLVLSVSGLEQEEQLHWAGKVLAHLRQAARWAAYHPADASRLLAQQLGIPEQALELAYSPQLHKELEPLLEPAALGDLEHLRKSLIQERVLAEAVEVAQAVQQEIADAAQALLDRGEIGMPQAEGLPRFALEEVPPDYFVRRRPGRVIADDAEAVAAAHAYAARIKAGASERDLGRRLPWEELRLLGESGLLGLMVPKAYGGPGIAVATLVEVFKIISAADGSIGQIPQNHHFFVKSLELAGTEQQKEYFFKEVLEGAQLGNALAERGIKSMKEMNTRLTKEGEGQYRLSGTKFYTTGALYSHWLPVTALDEEGKRVTVFVPRGAEGVDIIDDWNGIGQRTTASGSALFSGVQVSPEQIVEHWRIFEVPQVFGAFGQIMHAAVDIGIARAALDDAAWFVREKTRPSPFSQVAKASDDPELIRRFGELGIRLQAAEALLDKAAAAIDNAERGLTEESAGQAALLVDSANIWLLKFLSKLQMPCLKWQEPLPWTASITLTATGGM